MSCERYNIHHNMPPFPSEGVTPPLIFPIHSKIFYHLEASTLSKSLSQTVEAADKSCPAHIVILYTVQLNLYHQGDYEHPQASQASPPTKQAQELHDHNKDTSSLCSTTVSCSSPAARNRPIPTKKIALDRERIFGNISPIPPPRVSSLSRLTSSLDHDRKAAGTMEHRDAQ